VAASALAALAALGCEDLGVNAGTVPRDALLALPLQAGAAPVAPATFWVYNDRLVTRSLNHQDAQVNPYLRIEFPPGCLSRLDGRQLSVDDSVQVTVEPGSGEYGMVLSPAGLEFTLETPTVTFFYGRYADLSAVTGDPSFPTEQAYLNALEVWQEATVGQWRVARGSSTAGLDALGAAVDAPGELLVAAAR
jgi:hypothetical protein